MTRPAEQFPSDYSMKLLSRLLLPPRNAYLPSSLIKEELKLEILNLGHDEFTDLLTLAQSNHVIVRGLEAFLDLCDEERDTNRKELAEGALAAERARIENATAYLGEICDVFERRAYRAAVIKSLDHWPDLGSDLDLFTNASSEDVIKLMRGHFDAKIAPRSWGDRLARKWNFIISGLPEAVEIHVGRLGQTGEQVAIASWMLERARWVSIGGRRFRVPSPSDRLAISTLQRMYRHFYFRLCDVVDTALLSDAGGIDFQDLQDSTRRAGIWEGVATYLAIVSDYAKNYRGAGLDLPKFVHAAARFGGDQIIYGRGFLRVPIVPQSARLYGSQLAGVLGKGEFYNGARLSLLPWLATAAAVGQKITGSDKGIW
jgi:hypothetical protein